MTFENIDLYYEMVNDDNSVKVKKDIDELKDIIKTNQNELNKKFELLKLINEEKELQIINLRNEINENNKIMDVSISNNDENSTDGKNSIDGKNSKFMSLDFKDISVNIIKYNNFTIRTLVQHTYKPKFYFCLKDIDNMLYYNDISISETTLYYISYEDKVELIYLLNYSGKYDLDYNKLILKYGRSILGLCFIESDNMWDFLDKTSNPNKQEIIEFFKNYINEYI